MRENTAAGESEEKHAIGQRGAEKRVHAKGVGGEERQGWGHLCPPIPSQETNPDPVHCHHGRVRGIRKSPLPSLPDTWAPCSR